MLSFGSHHGVNKKKFSDGQKVVVKVDGHQVDGVVVSYDCSRWVKVRLDTPIIVKTITVTKRLFRKDTVETAVEYINEKSFYETEVGVVKDDGNIEYYSVSGSLKS
jgi:hypothetical protein